MIILFFPAGVEVNNWKIFCFDKCKTVNWSILSLFALSGSTSLSFIVQKNKARSFINQCTGTVHSHISQGLHFPDRSASPYVSVLSGHEHTQTCTSATCLPDSFSVGLLPWGRQREEGEVADTLPMPSAYYSACMYVCVRVLCLSTDATHMAGLIYVDMTDFIPISLRVGVEVKQNKSCLLYICRFKITHSCSTK